MIQPINQKVFLIVIGLILSLSSCSYKPSNEIDELSEEVIKKREGIDIRLTPIDQEKGKK